MNHIVSTPGLPSYQIRTKLVSEAAELPTERNQIYLVVRERLEIWFLGKFMNRGWNQIQFGWNQIQTKFVLVVFGLVGTKLDLVFIK